MLSDHEMDGFRSTIRSAFGCGLSVDMSRLRHAGIYVKRYDKWLMSIYQHGVCSGNDIEVSIDVQALVWPDARNEPRARTWLESQRALLESRPSNVHYEGARSEEFFRIGFAANDAKTFLNRFLAHVAANNSFGNWGTDSGTSNRAEASQDSEPVAANQETAKPQSDPQELALEHMLNMALYACAQSGQIVTTLRKEKRFAFPNNEAFKHYVLRLIDRQEGRCAITGLKLQFPSVCSDEEMLASLDRIDSNGHYESGNLQVVCRFVNRWKGDDADLDFRRLLEMVRG